MNGHKIDDCLSVLNKLLSKNNTLTNAERQELLHFLVEEKVKSIKIYEPNLIEQAKSVLNLIAEKKKALVEKQQLQEIARLRDLENSYTHTLEQLLKFKQSNCSASFTYNLEGLCLYIAEGEYPYTITELEKLGLQLIYFSKTLERINLTP